MRLSSIDPAGFTKPAELSDHFPQIFVYDHEEQVALGGGVNKYCAQPNAGSQCDSARRGVIEPFFNEKIGRRVLDASKLVEFIAFPQSKDFLPA